MFLGSEFLQIGSDTELKIYCFYDRHTLYALNVKKQEWTNLQMVASQFQNKNTYLQYNFSHGHK